MAEPSTVSAVLDMAALEMLLEVIGGEQELLDELIASFLEEAPPLLTKMREAQDNGDGAGLRMAAHTLKSSANDFGASEFARLCQELEDLAHDVNLEQSAVLVGQIEKEYAHVQNALLAIIGKPQAKPEPIEQNAETISSFAKQPADKIPVNLGTMAVLFARQPELLSELLETVYEEAPHLAADIQRWLHDLGTWQQSRPKLLRSDK
jgi:HPt (histidine-containing phosphotransfer) domain-containing protein